MLAHPVMTNRILRRVPVTASASASTAQQPHALFGTADIRITKPLTATAALDLSGIDRPSPPQKKNRTPTTKNTVKNACVPPARYANTERPTTLFKAEETPSPCGRVNIYGRCVPSFNKRSSPFQKITVNNYYSSDILSSLWSFVSHPTETNNHLQSYLTQVPTTSCSRRKSWKCADSPKSTSFTSAPSFVSSVKILSSFRSRCWGQKKKNENSGVERTFLTSSVYSINLPRPPSKSPQSAKRHT